jgi:hypothetical protein
VDIVTILSVEKMSLLFCQLFVIKRIEIMSSVLKINIWTRVANLTPVRGGRPRARLDQPAEF